MPLLVGILALWCSGGAAFAQMTITAGTVVAQPGDATVVVPILATTTTPLTLLSVDVTFDRGLCDRLDGQVIQAAGRTLRTPEEGGVFCPEEGRLRLVLFDLSGQPVVPPGNGPVAEWVFAVRADAAPGSFPLSVAVIQASNGPLAVDLESGDGVLEIQNGSVPTTTAPGTFTPTPTRSVPTPTATVTPMSPASCVGDCNGNRQVAINELITGVNIAFGNSSLDACTAFDANDSSSVEITELITAVNNALSGCPAEPCTVLDGCPAGNCLVLDVPLPLFRGGSTVGGESVFAGSCGGASAAEKTFLYTAPATGTYSIDTGGSAFDTVLYVREGSCSGTELACNDDANGVSSRVTVSLAAGERVAIVVDGFDTMNGPFALNITGSPTRPSCQTAGNVIANCGFESGDLTGWIVADLASPLLPLGVSAFGASSGFSFFTSAPTEGVFSAVHGFDGAGPGAIELSQDVSLPAGVTTLQFDYRAAWDLLSFATPAQDRQFFVDVEPFGGGSPLLQSTLVLTAPIATVVADTGTLTGMVDIASSAGSAVRLKFRWMVPEEFTGPAFFDLDNITVF